MRRWLSVRHPLHVEAAVVLALYATYEVARAIVAGDASVAQRHAHEIVALERSLNVFVEGQVQRTADALPGLIDVLGIAYLTLHLTVTAGVLLWLHRRRPAAFPLVRTTLLLASAIAVIGFLVFPTAPPRLAAVGLIDTVSSRHVDLNRGLVSSLYNPYAAIPSMHVGYAVIIGAAIARYARGLLLSALGILYPAFVLLVIVATGNHFLIDAAVGAAVALMALVGAHLLRAPPAASTS